MLSVFRSGAVRSVSNGPESLKALAVLVRRPSSTVAAPAANAAAKYQHDKSHFCDYEPPVFKPHEITVQDRIETWNYVNSVYFGPERDMKNFPSYKQLYEPPKVRLGFIPSGWFDFLHPKTGVSGGYVWIAGAFLFLMNKEYNPMDHWFNSFYAFPIALYFYANHPNIGPKLKAWAAEFCRRDDYWLHDMALDEARADTQQKISKLERLLEECEIGKYYKQAKEEAIQLQLEANYRQRLHTVFQEVKSRLDYEAEKTNLKRQFEQDHMVNWIVSNVRKSITPQQEKESIKVCINTLKELAGKQAAVA